MVVLALLIAALIEDFFCQCGSTSGDEPSVIRMRGWWLEIFTLSAPAMSDTANAAQLMLKCSSARDGVE